MLSYPPDQAPLGVPRINISVVGVGGAGGNVVDRLASVRLSGIDTLAVNTDQQALQTGRAGKRVVIGQTLTRGRGAGGDPVVGQRAAEESAEALHESLQGADIIFIAAGMGGGTGSGAAPVIASIARELGALTVALVTRPFSFEGRRRAQVADQGIAQLHAIADTVIIVPNDRLIQVASRTTSISQSFAMADTVLRMGVQGIADLMLQCGMINVDFADVRAIMGEAGSALLGIGVGHGARRAVDAVRKAMACPLLEGRLEGARRLLLNITGGEDLGLLEVNQAVELVSRTVDTDANIIFGAVIDPAFSGGRVKVTLVATGFGDIPPASLLPRPEQTSERAPASQASGQASALASREEDALREMPPFLHFRRS